MARVASPYDPRDPGPFLPGADVPPVQKNASGLTVPQVQVLLLSVLPRRAFDSQAALALLAYWQQRNDAAYISHRKRRVALLSQLP